MTTKLQRTFDDKNQRSDMLHNHLKHGTTRALMINYFFTGTITGAAAAGAAAAAAGAVGLVQLPGQRP